MATTGKSSPGRYTATSSGSGAGGYGIQGHKGGGGSRPGGGIKNPTPANVNPYVHSIKNISPGDEYSLKFLPNLLDNYDMYTYHWKLFITNLDNARTGDVLNTANQSIVVESGVTDLTIDKIELHGYTAPSVETGTGTQTHLKFEIVEPSGAGLIDKLFYQATALGIGNWAVMPCYLQLEFRARDPITSGAMAAGQPGTLTGLRWVWPIKITESTADVTIVGTKYEFDAIVYDELAQSNLYIALQNNVVLSGLTTFGNAMADLENKLNADAYEKLITNYSIPDTYRIIVDDELNVPLLGLEENKNSSFGKDYIEFSKKTATFGNGTSVDKIVDILLGSSPYFQQEMQGSATPSSTPTSNTESAQQMKKMWRIVTESHPIAYDALRVDNAVAVTIFVIKYDLGLADSAISQASQSTSAVDTEKRRMKEYIQKKILNKKYDYIFTGLNDQIINFDLKLNNSFSVSMSRFGGLYSDSATSMPGVSVNSNTDDAKKAEETLRNILHFINNAAPGQDVDSKINDAKNSIQTAKIDPATQSRYITLLNNAKPAARTKFSSQLASSGGLQANGTLAASAANATSLATPVNGLTFVSDVNINSAASQEAYDLSVATRKSKLRPVAMREQQNEVNLNFGIDPASNAGRSRTANIFSTALYSSLDSSFQSVKLTIKGDPYWLVPGPLPIGSSKIMYKSEIAETVSNAEAIRLIKDNSSTLSVNTNSSDNFIVIRFRTPRLFNDVNGLVDPFTEVETFSGVYKVTTITSKFEGGKFTQELACILDPMINLTNFLKDIENASKIGNTIGLPATVTAYPSTSIKNNSKIASTNNTPGVGVGSPPTPTPGVVKNGPGGGSSTRDVPVLPILTDIPNI